MTRQFARSARAVLLLIAASAALISSAAAQDPAPAPNGAPGGQAPQSFEGTWDLGDVGKGYHSLEYTLVNGCNVPRQVTVTLPGNSLVPIVFDQPTSNDGIEPQTATGSKVTFTVPPGEHHLKLDLTYPEPPTSPPGATFKWTGLGWTPLTPEEEAAIPADEGPACTGQHGELTSVHHRAEWPENADCGTLMHICEEAEEHWDIYVCVYNYSAPKQQDGGGRAGAKKRRMEKPPNPPGPTPNGSPCVDLWLYNEFVPSGQIRTPADCAGYIREQAHKLFEAELAPYRSADPAKWAWVPTGAAIDQLTVEQILTIKKLILNALPQLAP